MPLDTARSDGRRGEILAQAARLFGDRGFGGTSMRDIAAAAGILPGSLYHHFSSKEALLTAVQADAIDRAIAAVEAEVARHSQPWDRLEAAAVVHLRMLLTHGSLAAVVVDGRNQPDAARDGLVAERHRYEAVFRRLVNELDLPPGVRPRPFRLALLGALNWALTWYSPGGDPPEVVARDLFAVFRARNTPEKSPT